MAFSTISNRRKCDTCRKTYRIKHTCYGKSHRRPKSLEELENVSKTEDHGNSLSVAPTGLGILPSETPVLTQNRSSSEGHHHKPWCSRGELLSPGDNAIDSPVEDSQERISNVLALADEYHYSSGERARDLMIQAEITHQQSIWMRLKGDVKVSKDTIDAYLSSLNTGVDGLARNVNLTGLRLSQAMNHLYHFNFAKAHEEVKKSTSLPGREEHLLWDQVLCVGRIMRGEGRFEEAKTCFETCLRTPGLRKSKRFLVQSALADVYCELDYQTGKQSSYLCQAKGMVEPEVERLRLSSGQHLKGFRRLLLSLVEIKIRQGIYQDADILARELVVIYTNLREPDIVDRLGHVRARIALARLSPTSQDALERWKNVLDWNKFYNPLEEEVFTCGVVYLFLWVTWYKLGDINKSTDSFQNAVRVIERKQCQFLIPGIGTYLFYDVFVY